MVLIRSVTKDCLRKVTFVFEGPWNLFYFESVINKSGIHFLQLFTPQVERIHFHQELFKDTVLTNEGKERWRKMHLMGIKVTTTGSLGMCSTLALQQWPLCGELRYFQDKKSAKFLVCARSLPVYR